MGKRKFLTQKDIRTINKLLYGDRRCRPENRIGLLVPQCAASREMETSSVARVTITSNIHDAVESAPIESLTNPALENVRAKIQEVINQKIELYYRVYESQKALSRFKSRMLGIPYLWNCISPSKQYTDQLHRLKSAVEKVQKSYNKCVLNLEYTFTSSQEQCWNDFRTAIEDASRCQAVWDIVADCGSASVNADNGTRTIFHFDRRKIRVGKSDLDVIRYKEPALFLENSNGANFYFYPSFVVLENNQQVAIIAPNELRISGSSVLMLEESAASDAPQVDQVWIHAKKDGTRDLRYKDNPSAPIVEYYRVDIVTSTGVRESYLFSNPHVGKSIVGTWLLFSTK